MSVLICMILISCENKRSSSKISEELNHELLSLSESGSIKGFSVAIVNDTEVLYQNGFGFEDVENNKSYSAQTIQNIGSVSKVIIGIALLKAQELGKLNLNDPINNYLPYEVYNPLYPNEEITLKHLANHKSSIRDKKFYHEKVYVLKEGQEFNEIKDLEGVFNSSESLISMKDFLKKLLSKDGEWYSRERFAQFIPGEKFSYSNVGAALAAHVLEIATGESYPDFTQKYIFDPLNMTSTGWSFETIDFSRHSNLYYHDGIKLPFYRLQSYPDGGLLTSSSDLALLLRELIRGQSEMGTLLKKDSYLKLFGEETSFNASSDSLKNENPVLSVKYDTCLFMGRTASGYYGHTGGDPGIVCLMFFNSKNKLGRILIVNTHIDGSEEKILTELWDIWGKLDEYKMKLNELKSW